MSVRQSLLAILDQGPCYGYQLRAEFDRRTGSTWPLNVGQIYSTLDRLERDGLVAKGPGDEKGQIFYEITDAGSAEVAQWLRSPVMRAAGTRDELAIKIAVAATLPGVDGAEVVRTERAASLARLEALRLAQEDAATGETAEALAAAIVADAQLAGAEAELRWLDSAERLLARHPLSSLELGLSTERPKRGRPARVA